MTNLDNVILKEPDITDMDQIYMMGADVWGKDQQKNEYLNECKNSIKYKSGQWFALYSENKLLSSLLVHRFDSHGDFNLCGLGSIATALNYRNKGYGSLIIKKIIKFLSCSENVNIIFLYSDIDASFYENLGFIRIPKNLQKYDDSDCMAWVGSDLSLNNFLDDFDDFIPSYF